MAAAAAGVRRERHYRWLSDSRYKREFERAHKRAADAILGKIEQLAAVENPAPVPAVMA